MERNLVAGLFHASASLGIAESADRVARRDIAGRINGDARPRMQAAENAIDLAASRGVISRAALLIDKHHTTNPASDGSADELGALFAEAQAAKAFVNEAATRIVERALALSGGAGYLSRSPLAARTATSKPGPSCTHSAPTAPTTTSVMSRSANSPHCTEMALAAAALVVPTQQARPFRDAIGKFATGVAFVTAVSGGEPAGLIVNSLSSVSLEPPLISFSPSRSSFTWSRMRRAGRFGVNILGRQHKPFATRASPAGADRFEGIDWKLGDTGVPLLTDALAAFECEIVAEHPTGDHWIVVGQVNDLPSRRSQIRSSSSPAHSAPRDSKRMTTARAWLKVLAVDPTRDDRQASVLSLL